MMESAGMPQVLRSGESNPPVGASKQSVNTRGVFQVAGLTNSEPNPEL